MAATATAKKQRAQQWPAEYVRERNAAAWALREKGETLEAIGKRMPRADGLGVGVSKARAWQVVRREFQRRAQEATDAEVVEALFRAVRLRSLTSDRDAAMRRLNGDEGH